MTEPIDAHFVATVTGWETAALHRAAPVDERASDDDLRELLRAQLSSRHLDFAARLLQARGEGFYTIGSAGHEANAAIAMATWPSDPALLHYRSGGFYCARAFQVGGNPVGDILRSLTSSADDPISGGRHKVFGHRELSIIPQTSTIASHLPRAVGLAFSLDRAGRAGAASPWPPDAVVVTSIGDASVNHSTAAGALNAAGHTAHQGVPLPLVVVVEDNGIGISTRTPGQWTAATLQSRPGFSYDAVDGADPVALIDCCRAVVGRVRATRRPAIIHLRTVRYMGHAGSDAEIAYRTRAEIERDFARDPLLATAAEVVRRGVHTPSEVLDAYEETRAAVASEVEEMLPVRRLADPRAVASPLRIAEPDQSVLALAHPGPDRDLAHRGRLPEHAGPLTLAQAIGAALRDLLATREGAIVFGEDVAIKGGVYGVTRGLRQTFGASRVFDTLLDEQSILGTALGAALSGYLPIPEIQYLAYLHNAEDQLRGEAATLAFFSRGQYRNGMLVRIAGLAYQKGFGGHFHNDNALAVLRDIPGLIVAIPSSAAEAPGLVRALAGLAHAEGAVCVLIEPIALYHSRDLYPGDGAWCAPYDPPERWRATTPRLGEGRLHGEGSTTLIVTFGNGVAMSRRAAKGAADVYDLRWVSPLPTDDLLAVAHRYDAVLVADETRRSGGVSEGVVTALVDGGYAGRIARVTSRDSVIPLGPAATSVLLSEDDIAASLAELTTEGGS
ncbi:thiamine pyrophosphate-dependent enzyme [Janibacter sp. GXQ6167]|uniref:thiamine pyrophosphate-dependent enzyme n=1 Tax=Janibacter sp. GXQ6167 TaxID=3240791 RepID=UPI003525ADF6